jgi:hypothetical protein
MKRRLLSLFFLSAVALSGFTQNIELSDLQGNVIPANSSTIQYVDPNAGFIYNTFLNVKNVGSATISVLCKKVQILMLDSTAVAMCWAGSCYSSETFVSPNAQPLDPGQTNSEFSGDYMSTKMSFNFNVGESVVRWVFFNQDNVNDSVSVTIKYSTFGVGLEDGNVRQASLSNTYPNPASTNTSFGYSVPSGSDGMLIVRNILGSTMLSQPLTAGNGKYTVNTGNLSDGIYFYSLMIDGKISQTKKLIVKH